MAGRIAAGADHTAGVENGARASLLNIQPDTLADWLLIIRPTRITINLAYRVFARVASRTLDPPPGLARIDRGSAKRGADLCTRRKSNASRS